MKHHLYFDRGDGNTLPPARGIYFLHRRFMFGTENRTQHFELMICIWPELTRNDSIYPLLDLRHNDSAALRLQRFSDCVTNKHSSETVLAVAIGLFFASNYFNEMVQPSFEWPSSIVLHRQLRFRQHRLPALRLIAKMPSSHIWEAESSFGTKYA